MTKQSKTIYITHGTTTHLLDDRYDCLYCIEVELDYLQALKAAGGRTKFLKSLEAVK